MLLTQRFEQLSGVVVQRGAHLVTPAPGERLLRGHFVIRRAATAGPVEYPVATIEVQQGVRVLARLTFADGNDRIATDQVPALARGLRAGEYALKLGGIPPGFSSSSRMNNASPRYLARPTGWPLCSARPTTRSPSRCASSDCSQRVTRRRQAPT